MQWVLDHMQILHLAIFVAASISVEWRRPGLILSGFALLYLVLTPFTEMLRGLNPLLFMLFYVSLDMLGAALVFELCRPTRQNSSFTRKTWLALSGVLIAFWVAHYLNFCYTMGYAVALSTPIYNWITLLLAGLQALIVLPGAREGIYEARNMVEKKLAGADVVWRRSPSLLYHRPGSGAEPRNTGYHHRNNSDLLVDGGRGRNLHGRRHSGRKGKRP